MRAFLYSIFLLSFIVRAGAQDRLSADSVISAIQQIKNDTVRMDSLYHFSRKNRFRNPDAAINAGKILIKDAEQHGDKLLVSRANLSIAEAYNNTHDFAKSLKYYLEALRIQKELNLYDQQIYTMLDISVMYDVSGDFERQKKYVQDAVLIGEQHKDDKKVWAQHAKTLDFLATIYKIEGRLDTAVKVYNEVIVLARKNNDTFQQMASYCNMAIALKSSKKYEASLKAYNEAISLLDTAKDKYALAVITDNMAILFYQMDDLARSEQYALKALAMNKDINDIGMLRDMYETLKNIYAQEKKYAEAFGYMSKLSDVKDSIYSSEKSAKVKELEAKYDSENKDKQIAAQEAQIAFNKKIDLLLILTAILLVVIGILVLLNQRRKKHLDEQRTMHMRRQLEVKEKDNEIYRLKNVELKHSNDEIILRNEMIVEEKRRSEVLLLNILPEEAAKELLIQGHTKSRKYELATVMFIDFVGFTIIAEDLKAEELVERIGHYFGAFDRIILEHGLEKIKTIGDAYMCAGGLPVVNTTNPVDVVNTAIAIMDFVRSSESNHFFNVRIGIHSGPLVAGVVGRHKFQYDIWGDTVNVASRIEENSVPGRINISGVTYELVKHNFDCEYRGKIMAKNKGELDMYFVNGKTGAKVEA